MKPLTRRLVPSSLVADPAHGPLPLLLVALTVFTGIVDAVSILALGRVFVANMTGNVVFVGFAVAGAPGFSLRASVVGLAGFLVGAGAGGRLISSSGSDRARLLAITVSGEAVLAGVATVVVAHADASVDVIGRDVAVLLLAIATGAQNAAARSLAVPDLTTTVLTMTLTGLAADLRTGARRAPLARRLLAVVSMFGGAVVGALLVLHQGAVIPLIAGTALLAFVAVAAWLTTRHTAVWRTATPQPRKTP
ncbi:YoaK family protein [Intrasporangium mesophilum]